ncbi:hypothetical protein [Clostridium sp. BNL1100]|uniref:hypothetical protein n=1 Tax=Clostridium sp. BNL1100 TaxID=755731 RepID=UPI00024A7D14|nr:hypothetical protein [Clostridium sp. BNL1100]AEY67099.1 hypothetical protein Clo1100_2947 [Clostridium sp. BNL1100]
MEDVVNNSNKGLNMKILRKTIIFLIIFLISTEIIFVYAFPARYVYNQRINYDVFKDNVYSIELAVKSIKQTISREKINNYYIFIGDSVGYGTPCPPDKTISSYLNVISKKEGKDIRFFNLALPSTMFGDFYTVLLLLKRYGISINNVILNFSYWEINAKTPTYWFNHYLKELDNNSYKKMVESGAIKEDSLWKNIKAEIYHFANRNIGIIGNSGFVTNKIKSITNNLLRESKPALSVWSSKADLKNAMTKPENKWYFSDKKFNLTENSVQIYFINKIIELQKDKKIIFVLNAANNKLLENETSKQGYKDNIDAIEKLFNDKNVKFLNYNNKVDYKLFSDYVHLLPDGYSFIAQDLWNKIDKEI